MESSFFVCRYKFGTISIQYKSVGIIQVKDHSETVIASFNLKNQALQLSVEQIGDTIWIVFGEEVVLESQSVVRISMDPPQSNFSLSANALRPVIIGTDDLRDARMECLNHNFYLDLEPIVVSLTPEMNELTITVRDPSSQGPEEALWYTVESCT